MAGHSPAMLVLEPKLSYGKTEASQTFARINGAEVPFVSSYTDGKRWKNDKMHLFGTDSFSM